MVWTKSGQTQPDGRRGSKKQLFFRVLVSFSSFFLLFHQKYVYDMPFLQTKSVHLAVSSRRNVNCNCPPRIGGHHFLLCQHTNTEDIAGQSASSLVHSVSVGNSITNTTQDINALFLIGGARVIKLWKLTLKKAYSKECLTIFVKQSDRCRQR